MQAENDQDKKQVIPADAAVKAVDELKTKKQGLMDQIEAFGRDKGAILLLLGIPNNIEEQLANSQKALADMTKDRDGKAAALAEKTTECGNLTKERDDLQAALDEEVEINSGIEQALDQALATATRAPTAEEVEIFLATEAGENMLVAFIEEHQEELFEEEEPQGFVNSIKGVFRKKDKEDD